MLDWSHVLQHYGYFAVMLGAFFEGETVVLLGAYAVHQHVLNFWWLMISAMIGGFIGDQFYYQIGVRYGHQFISQHPKLNQKFQQATYLLEKYPTLSILLMRFAWGLRTVIPISIGIQKYPILRYMLINLLACFIWALLLVSIGLQVSHGLHIFWQYFIQDEHSIVIIFAVISCILLARIVFGVYIQRKNRHK